MPRLLFTIILLYVGVLQGQEPGLMVPIGHTDYISAIKFSPDSKRIMTASFDKTIKLWNARTGDLLANLTGHTEGLEFVQFSPDGKLIISRGTNNVVNVWNATDGSLLIDSIADSENIYYAAFTPDGQHILCLDADTLRVYATKNLALINSFYTGLFFQQSISPDGIFLATACSDSSVVIWDIGKAKMVRKLPFRIDKLNIEFINKGKSLLTWNEMAGINSWDISTGKMADPALSKLLTKKEKLEGVIIDRVNNKAAIVIENKVFIWDLSGKKLQTSLKLEHGSLLYKCIFSNDGNFLITAEDDMVMPYTVVLKKWKLNSDLPGKPYNQFVVPGINIGGYNDYMEMSADGKLIVICATTEKEPMVIDAANANVVNRLRSYSGQYNWASFNADATKIITASEPALVLWDTHTGRPDVFLDMGPYYNYAAFSPDSEHLILGKGGKTVTLVQKNDNSKKIKLDPGNNEYTKKIVVSADGKKILAHYYNNKLFIWEALTGKLLTQYDLHNSFVRIGNFSADGNSFITASEDSIFFLNTEVNDTVRFFKPPLKYDKIYSVELSHDSQKFVTTYFRTGMVRVYNAVTGLLIDSLDTKGRTITTSFSKDDTKLLLVNKSDYTVQVYDLLSKRMTDLSENHRQEVKSATFSGDTKFILTASYDNTCKLWNAATGRLIYTFLTLNGEEYFGQIQNRFYQCSAGAAKLLHYVTKDLKVITFEQLDVKYNRPDKVLEAIGNTDTALIKSYSNAWEKRIKKLHIDTTAFRDGFSIPEADFTNREDIANEQQSGVLKLVIKGNDSTYKLDRFNVWVNETPVFGQRGVAIRMRNRNDLDTTITIKLSQGENRIETSVISVNGTESYRMPLIIKYTPAIQQKESVRFIGIGIDRFADDRYNLQYSTKDIRDLSAKLKEKYKDDIIIDTLFNENVTVSNVKALKQKLLQTSENDKVIVAYSGHGMLSSGYDYYLSTYSVNFEKPEQNGLPYDELENLLDSIPARKKLMLIDACHSGEVDKEDLITLNASSDSLIKGLKPVAYKQEGHLGLKNSFELMQSLFVNVGKSTGATIISAAAGTQFALERNDLKNGVFTYSILEAMNKYPTLKISELKKIVGERVEQLTKGLQKPTSRNETIAVDWSVW